MSGTVDLLFFITLVFGNIGQIYLSIIYLKELRQEFYDYFHPEETLQNRIKQDEEFFAHLDQIIEEARKAV